LQPAERDHLQAHHARVGPSQTGGPQSTPGLADVFAAICASVGRAPHREGQIGRGRSPCFLQLQFQQKFSAAAPSPRRLRWAAAQVDALEVAPRWQQFWARGWGTELGRRQFRSPATPATNLRSLRPTGQQPRQQGCGDPLAARRLWQAPGGRVFLWQAPRFSGSLRVPTAAPSSSSAAGRGPLLQQLKTASPQARSQTRGGPWPWRAKANVSNQVAKLVPVAGSMGLARKIRPGIESKTQISASAWVQTGPFARGGEPGKSSSSPGARRPGRVP